MGIFLEALKDSLPCVGHSSHVIDVYTEIHQSETILSDSAVCSGWQ